MFYPSRARPVISESDYHRIIDLAAARSPESAQNFKRAVAHFIITAKPTTKAPIAGLGCSVSFMDVSTGVTKTVQLVGPEEADGERAKVSVLSPLGLALLGLSPRDLVQWQLSPHVRRTLEITRIESSEAAERVGVDDPVDCLDG